MSMEINITDEHIAKAESILLSVGSTFDDERKTFIRDFQTLDLQAVPGSGKTTTLLAKLIALEHFFPLPNNAGVLVLSHTNAAIEEIKERLLPHCPKLFKYPNFVGTIQTFVDTFLCIPAYLNRYKKKPYRIDEEIYEEYHYIPPQCRGYLNNRQDAEKVLLKSRLFGIDDLKYGFGIIGNFPMNSKNSNTYRGLLKLKSDIRKKGVLCYDDAYIIAEEYLIKFPSIKHFLQQRFGFVFVDEMQDMDRHQYNILESIFFDDGNAPSVFQRIGDKNQSIFNGNAKLEKIWNSRDLVLNINGSHRLTPQTAELVNCFALDRNEGFQVVGLRQGSIKPHLIVFEDGNLNNVLSKYSEIISTLIESGEIALEENNKFKAIAWIKENSNPNRIGLSNYFTDFNGESHLPKIDYSCLESYLVNVDFSTGTLESARKNILNVLLRVLRMEGVLDSDSRIFTKRKLLKFLKERFPEEYEDLKLNIYQWSMKLVRKERNEVYDELVNYIPTFLQVFEKEINHSNQFISERIEVVEANEGIQEEKISNENNCVNYHGFDIEVTTVHSAKGQTHTATLYLETDFYAACESRRLSSQFKFNSLNGNEGTRVKQSSKMCYVGMSRPTHLLCVAVHKARFDEYLNDIDNEKWEIVELD